MDKIKVNISGAADVFRTIEIKVGDDTITVRNHIPVAEKLEMARELTEFYTEVNEEARIVQKNPASLMAVVYMAVKYYTNADIDGAEPSDVYDWIINHDAWEGIEAFIQHDLWDAEEFADGIYLNIREAYAAENSLSSAVLKSFGFMFNGEDVTETLAKSGEVGEQMLGVFEQLRNSQRKADTGTVNIGGNIINIGKKQ